MDLTTHEHTTPVYNGLYHNIYLTSTGNIQLSNNTLQVNLLVRTYMYTIGLDLNIQLSSCSILVYMSLFYAHSSLPPKYLPSTGNAKSKELVSTKHEKDVFSETPP